MTQPAFVHITIRVPTDLHRAVISTAEAASSSISAAICVLLRRGLKVSPSLIKEQ